MQQQYRDVATAFVAKQRDRDMSNRNGMVRSVVVLGIAIALLAPSIGVALAQQPIPEIGDTLRSSHFAEPLVRTGATTPAEDRALVEALSAHERRTDPADRRALKEFLSRHPRSGWAAALWTNLGLSALHDGYMSQAVEAWSNAWALGKNASDPQARALMDRTLGELLRLQAGLGRLDAVKALLHDAGDRPVTGSATEAVQFARETLALINKDHAHLFNCGPTALRHLMLAYDGSDKRSVLLPFTPVDANGASLDELSALAKKNDFASRVVLRKPGQPVPVPSLVHWKLGHYGAITAESNGRFRVEDPALFSGEHWVTREALDAEASGYFLIAASLQDRAGWGAVSAKQMKTVRGKGPTGGTQPGDAGDPAASGNNASTDPGDPPPNNCPMCAADIKESAVGLTISDTPVGYVPPIGPAVTVTVTYNQREDSQPANFSFFNVSPKWTVNWLGYVTDDPNNSGGSVSRYLSGGGAYYYSGFNAATGAFSTDSTDGSVLVLTSSNPVAYKRFRPNGSTETYSKSDGSASYPRRIFLTQVSDPQGNTVSLAYDGQNRLTGLIDAIGRTTTFSYENASYPLLITRISDPFGRAATLTYDLVGRLISITDIIGITSSVSYDANSLVNSLTTPYGTTSFAYTAPGTSGPPRFVDITDPLGFHRRVEWLEPAPIANADPSDTVPQGMATSNSYLSYRNSFYWDQTAYQSAGCTVSGGCDYTKARTTHFLHVAATSLKSTVPESIKYPLENRIWFNYPGQSSSIFTGSFNRPSVVGRVLDDGTTQLRRYTYDTSGPYNLTQTIDPLGRTTGYAYPNHVDLAAVTQTTQFGIVTTLAQTTYDTRHQPKAITGADGETRVFTYNAAGQVTSTTNALGEKTQYQYNGTGDLTSVVNANGMTASSYTYDAFDRVATATDSEGWTVSYAYDAADRVTRVTYPDGTAETNTYDRLDLVARTDRSGRTWAFAYDANRRLISATDPAGQAMVFAYDAAGRRTSQTDPKGNVTSWGYDLQGRPITKTYADSSTVTTTYETTTSRVKSTTDALNQTKQFSYAKDDLPTGITYVNAQHTTPNVGFTYDAYFPRVASMVDGNGTTTYSYVPVGTDGALQVQQETPPLAAAAITHAYDALGRITARTVAGAAAETFSYDAIGRLTTHGSALGSFTYSYLGQTGQVTGRSLAGSTLATTWSYLPNSGDRRLAGIGNVGLSASQFTNLQFTTNAVNQILGIAEASDAVTVYPASLTQSATYNNLNQLTDLSGQASTWDANGNLLSDGQRTYTWDAENRLVAITYPGQSGKLTAFGYDGLGRRTSIASTPTGGGSTTATSYVWCGDRPCQVRDTANATIRSYYAEGEHLSGASEQKLYYGTDQIGSVRRVFASTTSAPAYAYDPYGNALQASAPATDAGYAGMLYNADSGLNLTWFRAYDPKVGRWLSRDPLGEASDRTGNLYPYVGGNPVSITDPKGDLWWIPLAAAAGFLLAPDDAYAPGPCDRIKPKPANPAIPYIGAIMGIGVASAPGAFRAATAILGRVLGGSAEGGAGLGSGASAPVGRSGNPIDVTPGTNQPATISGRDYTGHSLDRMQGRGVPSSVVENTIQTGTSSPGNISGTTAHYDQINNLTVVTDSASGRVITVRPGTP